jgi:hypothetical protein
VGPPAANACDPIIASVAAAAERIARNFGIGVLANGQQRARMARTALKNPGAI